MKSLYKRFNTWCKSNIDKILTRHHSMVVPFLLFYLFLLWTSVSTLFLVAGIGYGCYYVIRFLSHIIFKTSMPKTLPLKTGYDYERMVAKSLRRKGYRNVEVTSKSGDYGADVIGTDPSGNRVCIQCKFYQTPVGLSAVQEVVSAKAKYNCTKAAVYTNSQFTKQAKELAFVNDVDLFEFYDAILD